MEEGYQKQMSSIHGKWIRSDLFSMFWRMDPGGVSDTVGIHAFGMSWNRVEWFGSGLERFGGGWGGGCMMPTIRIDDEVWKALKESAEPFVDTPNDVLRRLLLPKKPAEASSVMLISLLEEGGKQTSVMETKRRGPKSSVDRTGEAAFRLPILQALVELGGQGSVGEVLGLARKHLKSELKPDDIKTLKSNGEVRWENTAKWERKHLLDDGLLDSSAPHGIWRITPLGRDYLKNSESL